MLDDPAHKWHPKAIDAEKEGLKDNGSTPRVQLVALRKWPEKWEHLRRKWLWLHFLS